MSWSVKTTGVAEVKTAEKPAEYDAAKKELLPAAERESGKDKALQPIEFQPVKSPNNYEAEFARKDGDVLFHFWPWGYHEAQDSQKFLPRFRPHFETFLRASLAETYGQNRYEVTEDPDMGAYFIRIPSGGLNQFYREMAIKLCEMLHKMYGGS